MPPRVDRSLTGKGKSLRTAIEALCDRGMKNPRLDQRCRREEGRKS
jgi:DNA-binding HxlR family transcriptional regulator